MHISVSRLKELLTLTEAGPVWNVRRGRCSAGALAGGVNDGGYLIIRVDGVPLLGHRVVWALHHGEWPTEDIDHKDTDRTNNHPDNLRLASRSGNCSNTKRPAHNTSGVKGLSYIPVKRLWRGCIRKDGKATVKHSTEREVVEQWLTATRPLLHGEYTNHG